MGSSASKVQPNVPKNAANSRVPNVRVPNSTVNQNVAANVYAKNEDPVNPNVNRTRPRGNSIYNEAITNATPTVGGRRKGKKSRKNKKSKK